MSDTVHTLPICEDCVSHTQTIYGSHDRTMSQTFTVAKTRYTQLPSDAKSRWRPYISKELGFRYVLDRELYQFATFLELKSRDLLIDHDNFHLSIRYWQNDM